MWSRITDPRRPNGRIQSQGHVFTGDNVILLAPWQGTVERLDATIDDRRRLARLDDGTEIRWSPARNPCGSCGASKDLQAFARLTHDELVTRV